MELGAEMCANQLSLKRFHTSLSERLPYLGHIQLHTVQVVDHLGRIIPIPTQFCSSWTVGLVRQCIASMTKFLSGIFLHHQWALPKSSWKWFHRAW